MDLNDLKERFNLQKLVDEFKAVIDDQPVVTLDKNDPVGQGIGEVLSLVKQFTQLQDDQRKIMDRIVGLLGAVAQKLTVSTADGNCGVNCKADHGVADTDMSDSDTASR